MSNSVNKVYLLGRLGHDPKVAATQSGKTVTTFSIATSEYVGQGPDKKEIPTWHNIVAWGTLGDVAGRYLKKGARVHVEGRISTRSYDGKDGQKKTVTEIIASNLVFLSEKTTTPTDAQPGPADPYAGQEANYQPSADDNGVPF